MAYRVRSGPPGPRRWSVLLRAPGSWPGWRLGSLGCRPSERGLLAVLDSGAELGMRAVAVSSAVGPVAVLLVFLSGAGFLVVAGIVVAGIGVAAGRVGPVIDRSEEHTSELQSLRHLGHLPSFPTRRSSDLVLLVCLSGAGFLVVAGIVVAGIGVAAGRVGPVIDVGHCGSSPASAARGLSPNAARPALTRSV